MRSYWITLLLAAVPLLANDQPSLPAPEYLLRGIAPEDTSTRHFPRNTGMIVSPSGNSNPSALRTCIGIDTGPAPCSNPLQEDSALNEFRKASKMQSNSELREALEHLQLAVELSPDNLEYRASLSAATGKLVNDDIHRGNRAMTNRQRIEALASFQEALELDPGNDFARQQLHALLPPLSSPSLDPGKQDSFPKTLELKPNLLPQTFHISGKSQDVIAQVCTAYGITASVDESVKSLPVTLDLDRVTWPVAMSVITRLTRTFWTAISEHQALFAADTRENRRNLERSSLRTFYLSDFVTPQYLNEIVGALRGMFELRTVTTDLNANSISVRANADTMDGVARLLQELVDRQPQVMLNVDLFQVSGSFTRSFGVTVPTQFQVFYIPTTAAAALMAQSLAQQGSATLNNFQFGTKQLALTLPSATVGASQTQSSIRTIDQVTLRASNGEPAVLKMGERYPILTSNYSSITNNASFQVPPPTFSYVDIGFDFKVTPTVHRDGTVGMQLELHLSALGAETISGLPAILNNEFNGFVSAKDGEPIIAAGDIMQSASRTRSGWPGLAVVPGLDNALSNPSKQVNDDELLIVITPHIISSPMGTGGPASIVLRSAR
jgi:general secretion pathway protein D